MGALVTKALRPIKSFNIENRAHRAISKEKPTPAPRYPKNIEDLKRTLDENPDIDEKLDKKDAALDNRLKEVYVSSFGRPEDDITKERRQHSTDRPLPLHRGLAPDYDFGFKEPDRVTYGRCTMRSVLTFISAHQADPTQATAAKIALEYKMREEDVTSILKYFKTYEIYLPETKKSPAVFAGPATLRKSLYKLNDKEIESKDSAEDKNLANKDSSAVKEAS